jgi:hypothetical protein
MLATIRGRESAGRAEKNLLDRIAIWDLSCPQVQILSLPCLEEEDVIAVVQLRKFAQLVQFTLGVELGVLPTVGHHRSEIIQKMAMSECNTSRREDEDSLLVLPDAIARRLFLLFAAALGQGLVDGGHILKEPIRRVPCCVVSERLVVAMN